MLLKYRDFGGGDYFNEEKQKYPLPPSLVYRLSLDEVFCSVKKDHFLENVGRKENGQKPQLLLSGYLQ